MAVSRSTSGGIIKMTAASDAITDTVYLQGAQLTHTTAATATLTIGGLTEAIALSVTTSVLADRIMFQIPIKCTGITAATLSAGTITLYTA